MTEKTEAKKVKAPKSIREALETLDERAETMLATREAELQDKYGEDSEFHASKGWFQTILTDSIEFDMVADKLSVLIVSHGEGSEQLRVYTSDLFQVRYSPAEIKIVRSAKAKTRRADLRAFKASE